MARRETIAVEEVLAEISSGHLPSYLRFCEVRVRLMNFLLLKYRIIFSMDSLFTLSPQLLLQDGISENVPYKKRLFAKDTWWNLKEDTSVNDVKRVMVRYEISLVERI
tara:strand:+ start:5448 stop:5771 length:324 start_codon:yes stop_codon:yes gene_type:complete